MLESQLMSENLIDENGESLNTTPIKLERTSKQKAKKLEYSLAHQRLYIVDEKFRNGNIIEFQKDQDGERYHLLYQQAEDLFF